jgi:mannose-6-phosphate isomerase-like protein (cupin superfamily)
MPVLIKEPTIIPAAGTKPKIIEEYFGRINSNSSQISIARMKSPAGWLEPAQQPEFDEYTVVLKGIIRVETKDNVYDVKEGSAILTRAGEWIRYSTPFEGGAEYIAVCIPAFSPETVHREE